MEYRYVSCDGDAEMRRYEIIGGGHEWPSTARGDSIDATALTWQFLRDSAG
jgi:poly(3-hydroxybutyrate) depolymerase